ncbi:protein spindle-F [Cimex lectularius]|uniref:UBZ1-type domain-containing protein n=1 Tax=Cimex lectularius TaxID=79782 RepID=A0A8I6TB99_CIMLE|nr:protein spindle-F [Cimex lectularius]
MNRKNSTNESSFLVGGGQDASSLSVHALKIALMTMKDRCQKLQNRLSAMEEENLQLRIERHSIPGLYGKKESDPNPELSLLNRKMEELLKQKSKLSHHVFMVATENKDLWEKIYKLAEEEYSAGNNHDIQPDVKHKYTNLKPLRSLQIAGMCKDGKEESLEEISLRGLSGCVERTSGHDNQSTKLTDQVKVKGCEFTLCDMTEEEEMESEDIALSELNEILEKLKMEKQILKQNQEYLKDTLEKVTGFINDNFPCKECSERSKEDHLNKESHKIDEIIDNYAEEEQNKSTGEVLNVRNGIALKNKENNFEDRICPLCTKFYAKSTPFDEFNDHVLSHFVEDSEQDSHISLYEVTA